MQNISWDQWEFQDPKLEVLYQIRPYVGGISPYIALKNRPYIYMESVPPINRFLKWPLMGCTQWKWNIYYQHPDQTSYRYGILMRKLKEHDLPVVGCLDLHFWFQECRWSTWTLGSWWFMSLVRWISPTSSRLESGFSWSARSKNTGPTIVLIECANHNSTGWWCFATPLKNMKVNGKDYPIYEMDN